MAYQGFNKKSRTENVIKSSLISSVCGVISLLSRFAFRTAFIYILSSEYLGIEGLFTNILNVLSLAELGIETAITYRLYSPIKENDIIKVGQLIRFYQKVYLMIAGVIIVLGLSLLPFLDFFLSDTSSVPAEINLKVVFVLYLLQTASTYLYSYKQTLLSADQKQYVVAVIQCVIKIAQYASQIVILIIMKDYVITLLIGIVVTLASNMTVSAWITHIYKPVFAVKERISREDEKRIMHSMLAVLCHKIGGTIFTSTDSIVLSKFIGLSATGIYSNYSMLISGVSTLLNKVFGSFTSSFGNAHISMSKEDNYNAFMKVFLLNMIFSGGTALCLWILMNDFICLWAGADYLLDSATVSIISIQYYMESARIVMMSYTYGCGLFHKDRFRPFIEAVLNLTISIVLVNGMGIAGVFLGTIISYMLTVFWREPYLLFKYEFCTSQVKFWFRYFGISMFTIVTAVSIRYLLDQVLFEGISWGILIAKGIICIALYSVCILIVYGRNPDFIYCVRQLLKRVRIKFNSNN